VTFSPASAGSISPFWARLQISWYSVGMQAFVQRTGKSKPNGHVALVEWKPERGLYNISGIAESEPPHAPCARLGSFML